MEDEPLGWPRQRRVNKATRKLPAVDGTRIHDMPLKSPVLSPLGHARLPLRKGKKRDINTKLHGLVRSITGGAEPSETFNQMQNTVNR